MMLLDIAVWIAVVTVTSDNNPQSTLSHLVLTLPSPLFNHVLRTLCSMLLLFSMPLLVFRSVFQRAVIAS